MAEAGNGGGRSIYAATAYFLAQIFQHHIKHFPHVSIDEDGRARFLVKHIEDLFVEPPCVYLPDESIGSVHVLVPLGLRFPSRRLTCFDRPGTLLNP